MDAQELTSLLTEVRATGFAPPATVSPGELLGPMLDHLGSPDPVLRDRLVYATFAYWIELHEVLTVEEVRRVLATVLDDEHLWLGIDGPEGDATLTRSFSVSMRCRRSAPMRWNSVARRGGPAPSFFSSCSAA